MSWVMLPKATYPPPADSPTMHCSVVCKKIFKMQNNVKREEQKTVYYLANISNTTFDQNYTVNFKLQTLTLNISGRVLWFLSPAKNKQNRQNNGAQFKGLCVRRSYLSSLLSPLIELVFNSLYWYLGNQFSSSVPAALLVLTAGPALLPPPAPCPARGCMLT